MLSENENPTDPKEQVALAEFYERRGSSKLLAAKWYAKAAEQREAKAQLWIAPYYALGSLGMVQNLGKAEYFYTNAAEQGNADVQYDLGRNYDGGYFLPQNKTKAAYWYTKAAEQGHTDAQFFLGLLYHKGVGVETDRAKARYWYTKAAEQGSKAAKDGLRKLDTGKGPGGCYVATCVYGSYDCPEVWTLRRFRDTSLSASWLGRGFIRLYYAISPKIVELFGNKKWFNCVWKPVLNKLVCHLQKTGTDSSPYSDRL